MHPPRRRPAAARAATRSETGGDGHVRSLPKSAVALEHELASGNATVSVHMVLVWRWTAYATGQPGDMYLVHPLTVHAADEHRGTRPRFMAQTPVFLTAPVAPGKGSALARAVL